jgi:hypothetical protein
MKFCGQTTITLVDLEAQHQAQVDPLALRANANCGEKPFPQKMRSTMHATINKPSDLCSKITQRPRPQRLWTRSCTKIPHVFLHDLLTNKGLKDLGGRFVSRTGLCGSPELELSEELWIA